MAQRITHLTVPQLAKLTGYTGASILNAIHRGAIPAARLPGSDRGAYRIPIASLRPVAGAVWRRFPGRSRVA